MSHGSVAHYQLNYTNTMPKNVKKTGVHLIYREGIPIAFFYRSEETNENTIYMIEKAGLEDIENLFADESKVKPDEKGN